MKSTLAAVVVLFCVQLAVGVPLIGPLFDNNGDSTTKHWEIEPREKTTKQWEVPEIQPRVQNQGSMKNSEILLTEEPFGGDGTVPPGAVNDGIAKEISIVPFGLEGGIDTLSPGAINDGELKEISMVPFGLEVGTSTVPPGALNDGELKEISMVPFGLEVGTSTVPPGALNDGELKEISMVPFGLEENDHKISMIPYVISKVPFETTHVPEGTAPPWDLKDGEVKEISMVPFGLEVGTGTVPPGALNDGELKEISMDRSSSPFMRGAMFLIRAFGF